MNLKSLLLAASMAVLPGLAQAFPDYSIYPSQEEDLTSNQLLGNIQFTFSGAYGIVISESALPFLENQDGDEVYCTNIRDFSAMQAGTVAFFFDETEINTNGEWTLTIPAGTLSISGEENPELTATWTLEDTSLNVGEYPQITLESITPAEGSKIATWGGGLSEIHMTTSDDAAVNYIGWSLTDVTDGEELFVTQGSENRYDYNRYGHNGDNWLNGLFFSVGGNARLVEGHTYRLDLRFCGIGYDRATNQYPNPLQIEQSTELVTSVTYYGATPPQQYAEATYVSVTPDPSYYTIDSADNAVFEITYSAPAKPVRFFYSRGEGVTADAGEWFISEDAEVVDNDLATKWTFKFFPDVVLAASGTLISNVVSMDNDGLYVRGSGDYDFDNIYYQMVWTCNAGAPALEAVSPEKGATVDQLSSITITNGINGRAYPMSVSGAVFTYPEIWTKDGGVIRTLNNISFSEDGTQATWTFEPVTATGEYVLMVPFQYFSFGAEADGYLSNTTYFEYYVENNNPEVVSKDLLPVEVTPEDNSVVGSLGTVTLTFANVTNIDMGGNEISATLYRVVDGEDEFIEEAEPIDNPNSDWFNPTIYDFYFTKTYENGDYKIVVPEGMFFDSQYAESDGVSGSINPEFELHFTVEASFDAEYSIEVLSVAPEANEKVEELSTVTLTFPETVFVYQEVSSFSAEFSKALLYKITEEGEELVQSVVPFDNPESNYMYPTIYDLNFDAVAEDGNYKVVVPQGLFGDLEYLESKGHAGKANAEFTVLYVVGKSVGIESVFNGVDSIDAYDVNGVEVLKNAALEDVKTLKPGIYVVNGKKVIIRK